MPSIVDNTLQLSIGTSAAGGMPPNLPFGFPFPYVPSAMPPYGYQAPPVGFPFLNGMRKDLSGQGQTDPGNGDNGSNGDDCSKP